MSREIKFRFWDTKEGKWLGKDSSYWKELTFKDCRNKLIASMRQGNIIAEQYTGLTDKNGKEIYEGDIVRYSFTNPNRTYTEPVSFGPIQDGEGYCHQEFLAWRTTYVDDGEAHSSLLDLVEPNWACEIIGDIHENKELLDVNT